MKRGGRRVNNKLKRVEMALRMKRAAKKKRIFLTEEGVKRLDKIIMKKEV